MALKRLPYSIQSLFYASTQMNSYKKAIEELVYNAIDADAVSIAIRVNIEENTFQVIDNGYGVAESDFSLLGQRYTTSKYVDLNVLKSAPDKYGFRGQSLASLIEVSQSVKITSRCENSDETWIKVFHNGKEKELSKTAPRPSKGTTVEIKGFLYNLNIQKRAINSLNELNDIKSFLEQLSLIHNNISLSLRDESKNEIVFKLHKNRDIYQTLSSLFGVEKTDVQELKVEKNQYKVTGYIGKNNNANQQHWIYLNGNLVQNSKLHKVVHDNLTKALGLTCNQTKRNAKSKNAYNEEENVSSNKKIPFYFIFINCPYHDYDISDAPKQSIVEFKNWEQINKLLDKLVKFYVGDIKLKEIAKPINKILCTEKEEKTREQVKKIMEKILRSNPKKLAVSQMQNGIRGKLIKRKTKKKTLKLTLSKVLPLKDKESTKTDDLRNCENAEIRNYGDFSITSQQNGPHLNCNGTETKLPTEIMDKKKTVAIMRKKQEKTQKVSKYKLNNEKRKINRRKCDKIKSKVNAQKMPMKNNHKEGDVMSKKSVKPKRATKNVKQKKSRTISTKRPHKSKEVKSKSTKAKIQNDPLISHFAKATNSVKQRCNILATKVNDLMTYKKPKRQVFINETVHYSSVIKNNKNIAIRKKVGEIIIHDYVPLPPKTIPCSFDNRVWDGLKKKTYVSTYDLVQTILKSQQKNNKHAAKTQIPDEIPYQPVEQSNCEPIITEPRSTIVPLCPKQTYESHNYFHNIRNRSQENHEFNSHTKKPRNMQFITKQSRDNFITAKERETFQNKMKTGFKRLYFGNKKSFDKRPTLLSMFNLVDTETEDHTSYSIEFSKSNDKELNADTVITNGLLLFQKQYKNGTYTMEKDDDLAQFHPSKIGSTYTIITSSNKSKRMECEFDKQIHTGVRKNTDCYKSINVQQPYHSVFFTQRYEENTHAMRNDTQENEETKNYVNIESEHGNIEVPNNIDIEPLNVCETILRSQYDEKHQSNNQIHSWNDSLINNLFEDSLFNDGLEINSLLCDRNVYSSIYKESCPMMEADIQKQPYDPLERNNKRNDETVEQNPDHKLDCEEINNYSVSKLTRKTQNINLLNDTGCIGNGAKILNKQMNNFSMKNRHRFVPKGLSPIFENCQSKNMCDYNLDKDYFEKTLYSNFANDVQINSEIFEPKALNVKELTTRDIEKVNIRLNKDHASLIFNGESLKHANVLRQVDEKFIAAKINGKSHQSNEMSEYLVLFDQHAVHERIRLENNLKDYIKDDKWKSITLDDIPLKLSENEVIYLHNYKDKFTQFGLQWTVLNNCEVSIHAIPEAVLGKNPRQVDVVIKAVRNLISEEINTIKTQKGCVCLYPKSIMELVFSEACRYAIKFGDRLSKHACIELLGSLSECKNPFQCAHGRPVMAVVMVVKSERRKYELSLPKVHQFVRRS